MTNAATLANPYVLGLDLGSNSVGWAAVTVAEDNGQFTPTGLLNLGARIFEAGSDGELEKGKEESRGVARRMARQIRRQHNRAARRLDFLYLRLRAAGLLPPLKNAALEARAEGNKFWVDRAGAARVERPRERYQALKDLDQELQREAAALVETGEEKLLMTRLMYWLRAAALDKKLSPFAVGRALFHLAQRRGFLSNRKIDIEDEHEDGEDDKKKKEELGKVKAGIKELDDKMSAQHCRTLGELFLRFPDEERIRGRWTARAMYESEFEQIWQKQAEFHPGILTGELKRKIHRAIFRQRPLQSAANLIGECQFEKGRKRAPWALLAAQRFRYLQQLNNTEIQTKNDLKMRALTADERKIIVEQLENNGDLTFIKAKELLGQPKTTQFNYEAGGEKKFIGNRTAAKLVKIFGAERWRQLSANDKDAVIDDLRVTRQDEILAKHGCEKWGLTAEMAEKFKKLVLEDDYCALSRQALAKFLPELEKGERYGDLVKPLYGDRAADSAADVLPTVADALPALRNPTVARVFTELRRVVNALTARYGKPAVIRIELARELRKNRKAREQIWKKNRDQEDKRAGAGKSLLDEVGISEPNRDDIDKMLLYKEANKQCPYCGKIISVGEFTGGGIEVEHIIPFSISLDNSYLNKTIACRACNQAKGNRTPYQAFGHDAQRWYEIELRAQKFPGGKFNLKVQRLLAKDDPQLDDFSTQQLNDTAYAAKEAQKYLGLLYGADAKRKIQAARGGVTAFLRAEWGLNRVLNDGGDKKNRDDHRHHAIDAVVTALTDRRAMQTLSEAAVRALSERRRRFGAITEPWAGFLEEVRARTGEINVSRRVSRRVSGALHEATYYGERVETDEKGKEKIFTTARVPVHKLSAKDILSNETIIDPAVRLAVQTAFNRLPKPDPKLLENSAPYLTAKDGRKIPIRRVRTRFKQKVVSIGEAERQRHVITGNNHHAEIVAVLGADGKEIEREWKVVTMLEAYHRKKNKQPVIQRDHGASRKFLFSLSAGELVTLLDDNKQRDVFVCRCVSDGVLDFSENKDARKQKDIIAEGKGQTIKRWIRIQSKGALFARKIQKIIITPLGEIRTAND
ncbi:CRISPR-associated endonuclease Cas9 [Planctomycetales bacterium]|nr:CRISPR-associated endonuclease Cas9 [Planctomycetales bacterium]